MQRGQPDPVEANCPGSGTPAPAIASLAAETVEAALVELAGRRAGSGELTSADLPHGITYPAQPATLRAQEPVDYAALAAGQNRDALRATAATPYSLESLKPSVVPEGYTEVVFVSDGKTASFGVSPGDTLESIALAFNTSLGATVVSVADVYAGGNFYPNGGFRFSGTRRLDFTGKSPEGLAILGLALEFSVVGGMPVGIIAPRDTYSSLVSTDANEDRSTGAAVGMRLTDTILRLRDQLDWLRAEFDAYRAAHP